MIYFVVGKIYIFLILYFLPRLNVYGSLAYKKKKGLKFMAKKIVSLVVTLVLILSVFSVSSYAEASVPETANVSVANQTHLIVTHYGCFYVPYGTVVGYNNTTSGIYVQAAQSMLKHTYVESDGIVNCDPGKIDSLFGPATYNAIYAFQVYFGLSADGACGDETFGKFESMQ